MMQRSTPGGSSTYTIRTAQQELVQQSNVDGSTRIAFGKHNGKTFEEVATTDSGYCQWVLNLGQCNGQLALFKAFLQGTAPTTDSSDGGNWRRRLSTQSSSEQQPLDGRYSVSGQPPQSSSWIRHSQNTRGGHHHHHLPTFQEYAFSAPPATRSSIGGASNATVLPTFDLGRGNSVGSQQTTFPPYQQTPQRTLPWGPSGNNSNHQQIAGYRTKSAPAAAVNHSNVASDGKTYNFRMEIGTNGCLKLVNNSWLPNDLWRALSFDTPMLQRSEASPAEFIINEALMPNTDRAKIIDKVIADVKKVPGVAVVEAIPQFVLSVISSNPVPTEIVPIPEAIDAIRPPLKPYQRAGVEFALQRKGRCLLGDEMGLGKTLQALAVALAYRSEWPVLVICPASLKFVWKDQIMEWLENHVRGDEVQVVMKGKDNILSDAKFVIIGYPLINNPKFQTRPNGSK
ncbi:hypothetical protein Pmar_PMAR024326 [Perkinsus marinus ATCC 50983]|uniref:Uncharacterized protein n=1 Tax=Perkinsus marinus (strain ATCC 50983 / TXsc) TaxID=423536 RepID=C5LFF9_PERM5|nr:hypothetical protein Pmar_PMAR024326 [Perkinsus marinus ATCC 50983]EER04532.1 hypothetical protein Pmar_PMAR024326 [Perkinsus marinus ATCC 50983]|eukprot:XP_002772716.1 hypothetical protein Pmar_PMAR024326 [Perkinsus marinus ATCC 50983]